MIRAWGHVAGCTIWNVVKLMIRNGGRERTLVGRGLGSRVHKHQRKHVLQQCSSGEVAAMQ
jgi:hypothetical protein